MNDNTVAAPLRGGTGPGDWIPSSRANPCPTCDRTKDGDCRVSADGQRVICHHPKDLRPGDVVNGYAFTGNTADDRGGHFVIDVPREGTPRKTRSTTRRKPAPQPPAPAPLPDSITLALLPEPFPAAPPDHFPQGHRITYGPDQWTHWEDGSQPGKSKGERPRHRTADGKTAYSAGSAPWPLFGAELLPHARGQWISAAEGPKCAQWLQAGGLVAVSQPGHDHKDASIRRRFEELQAAGIAGMAYLSDHDDTGRKKAAQLAQCAAAVGFPFLEVLAADVWLGIPEKGSIDDAPGSPAERVGAVEAALGGAVTRQHARDLAAAAARVGKDKNDPGFTELGGFTELSGGIDWYSENDSRTAAGLGGLVRKVGFGWIHSEGGPPTKTKADAGDLAERLRNAARGLTRFNDLTRRIEFAGEAIEEDRAAVLYAKLQACGWQISSQHTTDGILDVAYDARYHPVRQYLDAVAGAGEIAPVDLDRIATTYLGTSDPLADSMLRKALIGAVARVYDPGCQFDSVCVLRGKQGIRKSSFWKVLASPGWFNCTAPDNDKDLILNIHSCWIFELAELENITGKREVGQLRNLITTSTDLIRVPYGKTTAPYLRRSILVGSVNGDAFLRDDEGSRRFWVIECPQDFDRGELIDVDRVCRDRDAIWRAAVLAYLAGERPCLDHDEQVASNRQNGRYEQEHPWAEQLDKWAKRRGAEPFTTAEALIGAKCCNEGHVRKQDAMDAATVLKSLGFQREANPSRAGNGGRSRRWHNLAQPGTTSDGEVVPGEKPVVPVDTPTPAQPAQPFSRKAGEVQEERPEERAAEDPRELLRIEVVPPPPAWSDPLRRNGATPAQPPLSEVVPEVVPGPDSVSPRTVLPVGTLVEVLIGDPPAWVNGHRIALIERDFVRVVNVNDRRDWRRVPADHVRPCSAPDPSA